MALDGNYKNKLEKIYSVRIQIPGMSKLHDKYEELMVQRGCAMHPSHINNLLVVGLTGVGKTDQAIDFSNSFPPVKGEESTKMRVVYADCPSPFTLEKLYVRILKSVESEFIPRASKESVLREMVVTQLKDSETELLFLDEIQHMFSMSRDTAKIMDTLKDLANGAGVSLVCIGKPDAAALRSDPQTFRRLEPYPIDRFSFDENFLDVLARFEDALDLEEKSNIAENEELAKIIYDSTLGIFDYIKKIMVEAAKIAVLRHMDGKGPEKLTKRILTEAYLSKLAEFEIDMHKRIKVEEAWVKRFIGIVNGLIKPKKGKK